MPYLPPAKIVEQFSNFTRKEIRPVIKDDEQFMQAQAGSMSSTLRFLSNELEQMETSIQKQESAFRDALDDIHEIAAKQDGSVADIDEALTEARDTLQSDVSSHRSRERELLEASNKLLEAIENDTDGDDARELRRPMYRFIDIRLNTQLKMLGRDPDE